MEGYISNEPRGSNGFGYDPIFIPKNKNKTFGEMSSLQINQLFIMAVLSCQLSQAGELILMKAL